MQDFVCLCISWISSQPSPSICLDPSEWHPCPQMYWLHSPLVLSGKLVHFLSSKLLGEKKKLNKIGPRMKNSACNWCPSRIQTTSHYPLSPVILSVFHAYSSSSIPITSPLECKVTVGNLSSADLVVTWQKAIQLVKQFPLAVEQKHATMECRGPRSQINWL